MEEVVSNHGHVLIHFWQVLYQVCQVGLVSSHEEPVSANRFHPVVGGLVQIYSDVVLQMVPESKKNSFNTLPATDSSTGSINRSPFTERKQPKAMRNYQPAFQSLANEEHRSSPHIFGKKTFDSTKLALADNVIKGRQGLARRPVHIG